MDAFSSSAYISIIFCNNNFPSFVTGEATKLTNSGSISDLVLSIFSRRENAGLKVFIAAFCAMEGSAVCCSKVVCCSTRVLTTAAAFVVKEISVVVRTEG